MPEGVAHAVVWKLHGIERLLLRVLPSCLRVQFRMLGTIWAQFLDALGQAYGQTIEDYGDPGGS